MMTAISPLPTATDGTATEVGKGLWILRPATDLDDLGAGELQNMCIAALDRGALNVVVDLSRIEEFSLAALDVLVSTSEALLARGGSLWLASMGADECACDLVQMDERGFSVLEGVSPALDRALSADEA